MRMYDFIFPSFLSFFSTLAWCPQWLPVIIPVSIKDPGTATSTVRTVRRVLYSTSHGTRTVPVLVSLFSRRGLVLVLVQLYFTVLVQVLVVDRTGGIYSALRSLPHFDHGLTYIRVRGEPPLTVHQVVTS